MNERHDRDLATWPARPWIMAAICALAWGAVIAFAGWFTASYNHYAELLEFPFLSGVFAVLLAAPLFQTARVKAVDNANLKTAPIELGTVQRRQFYVDGKPVDEPF